MKGHRLEINNERELQQAIDEMYSKSKEGCRDFYGLLELANNPITIMTAIHKIKSNKGSNTAGIDGVRMKDILQKDYEEVVTMVQAKLENYKPLKLRRKFIDKPGKKEKRPLGIPAVTDRIIQEIIRMIIEPILEGQFFSHSYGFRPMRDQSHALARVHHILWQAKCTHAVEGDIRKFFDNVDHNILLKKLWKMGIKDKRVLMLIKKMLKAGVMGEIKRNEIGTPQGGIISPLLANVYLHDFDKYVASFWEEHPEIKNYAKKEGFFTVKARPKYRQDYPRYYLVRYADDWVILTDTKENALKMKELAKQFLKRNGQLELSEEKTFITDVQKEPLQFLGIETRVGNSRKGKGKVTYSKPSSKSIKTAITKLKQQARKISRLTYKDKIVHEINKYNQIVVGLSEYWKMTSQVTRYGSKVDHQLWYKLDKTFMKITGTKLGEFNKRKIQAEKTDNLPVRHKGYKTRIPFIEFEGCKIGVTQLAFTNYVSPKPKIPKETPFSKEGRTIWEERTEKKLKLLRPDEVTMLDELIQRTHTTKKKLKSKNFYNYEYWMNRGYALNRDKCQCQICKTFLYEGILHTHHRKPYLPMDEINKVSNLSSLCQNCHKLVHNNEVNPFNKGSNEHKKLEKLRQQTSIKG